MPAVDIIIFVVFAIALVYGAIRGAIRQIGTFAAFIAGVVACRLFGAALVAGLFPDAGAIVTCCTYVLLFIVVFGIVVLVARLLKGTLAKIGLGPVDRIAGALLSILICAVIVSACLNAYFVFVPDSKGAFCRPEMPWRGMLVEFVPRLVGYVANT